jgi:hypothetical protein
MKNSDVAIVYNVHNSILHSNYTKLIMLTV